MFCPYCGEAIETLGRYCPFCGEELPHLDIIGNPDPMMSKSADNVQYKLSKDSNINREIEELERELQEIKPNITVTDYDPDMNYRSE